jgi:hypothetical protein
MKGISVSKDNLSGIWNVAPDGLFGPNGATATLDAALFEQENLPAAGTALVANSLFSLIPGKGDQSNTCNLHIAAQAAGFDGSQYREPVKEAFDDFLVKVEQKERHGIRRGTTGLFRRLLSNLLPATFRESLYFHYGHYQREQAFRSVVDLHAGMRLRIEWQFSQLVPGAEAGSSFNPFVNGYVGAGQSYFHLIETHTADGSPQLGFDAFLASNVPAVVTVSTGGAAGVIDISGDQMRRRWFRLCYPPQYGASDSAGWIGPAKNVVLIGADDLGTLESATAQCISTGQVNLSGAVVAFFRGRTLPIPEILCFVNAAPCYVPVGTTVRQLFSRFAGIPHLAGFAPQSFPYLRHAPEASFLESGLDAFPNPYRRVTFQSATVVAGPDDAYDVPVLSGDAYNFEFKAPLFE